LVLKPGSQH